jgi:MerR family transcriptional regulator, thiopeptide resistance regulator
MDQYEQEAQARWGDTEAYKESASRTSKYSHADFAAAKVDQELPQSYLSTPLEIVCQ